MPAGGSSARGRSASFIPRPAFRSAGQSADDQVTLTLGNAIAALWWVIGGADVFLGLVLYVPVLRELFRFAELHWIELGVCLAAGAASTLWFELFKLVRKQQAQPTMQ
jgi:hypothetical protein